MTFYPSLKKALFAGTVILLCCDISMLFVAPGSAQEVPSVPLQAPQNSVQLQQLQTQVQQQLQALQQNAPSPPPAQAKTQAQTQAQATPPAAPVLPAAPFADQAPVAPAPVLAPSLAPPVSAPSPSSAISENDLNNVAFNSMVQNTLPMSPQQIQKLRSLYMASQFAASSIPGTPPRPTATSAFVDLSPGAVPPVIRLAQGFVTSLVFVDSTGASWPIESYDVGNPSAFNIQWDKTSNTLMVQSSVLYTYGNLAVKLKGLDTPVMITLVPGQKAVDYRVDLRVQGFGPNAKSFSGGDTLPAASNADLLNILDGIPPPNSQNLKVDGGDCQAWSSGGKMYVRTRLSVLSPGWISTLSSADGMHAYEMQPSPMLLVSHNGQVMQLRVKGL